MVRRSRNVTKKVGGSAVVATPCFAVTFYRGRKYANVSNFGSFDLFPNPGISHFLKVGNNE